MRTLFALVLLLTVTAAGAQTRRIAHRSHSGAKTERYLSGDGSYGYLPRKVIVHLESGKDTAVWDWDSLAHPKYKYYMDTTPRANIRPKDTRRKEDIREMGAMAGKMTATSAL